MRCKRCGNDSDFCCGADYQDDINLLRDVMQDAINNLLEWADYEGFSEGQLNGLWPIIEKCKNALKHSKGE